MKDTIHILQKTLLFLVSLFIFFITNCSQNNISNGIKRNGELYTYSNIRDTLNSKISRYDKDGNIISEHQLVNGQLNGYRIVFYKNKSIKIISNYINGVRTGNEYVFYPNKKLMSIRDYIELKGGNILNNCVTFTESGDTIPSQTTYFITRIEKDTMELSSLNFIDINVKTLPDVDSVFLCMAKFDEKFSITDTAYGYTLLPFEDNKIRIQLKPERKGENFFRAEIVQYSYGKNIIKDYYSLYLNKTYYVK